MLLQVKEDSENDEEKMFLHKDAKENQTKYSTGSSFLIEKDNINPKWIKQDRLKGAR